MNRADLASYIDHTVLKPSLTDNELRAGCETAKKYNVAALCVKPCHVKAAALMLAGSGIKVCTVIGFPHGSTTTSCKVFETGQAIDDGASEVDMVINLGKLISGEEDYVFNDIKEVVHEAHKRNVIVKVIIETSELNTEQKIKACRIVEKAGADFVKTSTGFASGGATVEDIRLIKSIVGDKLGIKASGGIKDKSAALAMIEAGATRLGMSSTVQIMENYL